MKLLRTKLGFVTESRLCGVLLLAVLLATVLSYREGMTDAFSSDDYPHLLKNVRLADARQALSVFAEQDGREYRPLVRLSLWLNWRLSQDAAAFHWTNLLLHLGNAACLLLLLRLLLGHPTPALIGGAAFALHPIHSTNVLFVMGRTDLLFSLFYLGALLLFLLHWRRGGARTLQALSALLFGLALLSKEMAVSLPVLLLAMRIALGEGALRARMALALRSTLPHFLILLCYAGLRLQHLGDDWGQDLSGYLNFAPSAILGKAAAWAFGLAYPFDLYRMRHLLESEPLRFLAIAGAVCALALAILHLAVWRRWRSFYGDPVFWLGIAWLPITLLPILGGSPHRWYLYLPSAGFCMALAAAWRSLRARPLCAVVLAIGLLCYALELAEQSRIWSRQSELSEEFLQQAHGLGMRPAETHWFANMPFGYKSAFLFTFDSFADAFELHFGYRPDIRILSYVNLDDELRIDSARIGRDWRFRLEPGAYGFFLFPPAQRRFAAAPSSLGIQGAKVEIKALSPANTVAEHRIRLPRPPLGPLHYFDGLQLQTASAL